MVQHVTVCYNFIRYYEEWNQKRIKVKHECQVELFTAGFYLNLFAFHIRGLLLQIKSRNRFAVIITDRYGKLTSTIPTPEIMSSHAAHIFLKYWLIAYGIAHIILFFNGQQFVSNAFISLRMYLSIMKGAMTVNHSQTNRQVEYYNSTFLLRPRLYVTYNLRNWDKFVQPLTYGYDCLQHQLTNVPPFSLKITRKTPGPVTIDNSSAIHTDALAETTPKALQACLLHQCTKMTLKVYGKLRLNQRRYKKTKYFGRKARLMPKLSIEKLA